MGVSVFKWLVKITFFRFLNQKLRLKNKRRIDALLKKWQ